MKKLLSIVLALCFVLSMTGVALAEDVQTINVCIGSQPETLDPQLNSASDGSNYIKHLFEGLMKYGWNGEGVVNGVADNYTVSDDGLVYTFHIRDDAKWSRRSGSDRGRFRIHLQASRGSGDRRSVRGRYGQVPEERPCDFERRNVR